MSDDVNPLMYVNGAFAAVRSLPPDAGAGHDTLMRRHA